MNLIPLDTGKQTLLWIRAAEPSVSSSTSVGGVQVCCVYPQPFWNKKQRCSYFCVAEVMICMWSGVFEGDTSTGGVSPGIATYQEALRSSELLNFFGNAGKGEDLQPVVKASLCKLLDVICLVTGEGGGRHSWWAGLLDNLPKWALFH